MFDVGFSELVLIGVVALVVLGPERLPGAARTAGAVLRRARNSWASVKAEVEREIVRLTSLGCTSHEIAAILGMSRWTVENHQFQAKERLGVSKAALLTRIAIKYKISPLNDELSKAELRKLGKKPAK